MEINFHPISWPHKRKYYTKHSLPISQSQITLTSEILNENLKGNFYNSFPLKRAISIDI
jgi:hypothetical protein